MSMAPPLINIIVPAYNEGSRIGKLLDVLNNLDKSQFLITVVDDGSTDDTNKVVSQYPDIDYIRHPVNQGKGAAMATGIENASGDIILFVDADLIGFKIEHIHQLLKPLVQGTSEIGIGYMDTVIDGWFGRPLSGTRAFMKSDVQQHINKMKTKRYGIEIFLNYQHHERRYNISKLSGVTHPLQTAKYSGVKGYKLYFYVLWQVWQEILSYPSPLKTLYRVYLKNFFI